jgi:hypothetical protein
MANLGRNMSLVKLRPITGLEASQKTSLVRLDLALNGMLSQFLGGAALITPNKIIIRGERTPLMSHQMQAQEAAHAVGVEKLGPLQDKRMPRHPVLTLHKLSPKILRNRSLSSMLKPKAPRLSLPLLSAKAIQDKFNI